MKKSLRKLEAKLLKRFQDALDDYKLRFDSRLNVLTRELQESRLDVGNLQDKVSHLQRQVEYILVPVVSTGIPHRITIDNKGRTLWHSDGSAPTVVSDGLDITVTVSNDSVTKSFLNGQETDAVYSSKPSWKRAGDEGDGCLSL